MKKENIKYSHNNNYVFNSTYTEIYETKIYEKFFEVQENDIVMDIGSNIGLFPLSIVKKYKFCYVIEPDPLNFQDLKFNLKDQDNIIFINDAIDNKHGTAYMVGNESGTGIVTLEKNKTLVTTRTFKNIIKNYKIDNIDFLKLDSEGGEYFILTKENEDILKNINFISAEIHIRCEIRKFDKNDTLKMLNVLEKLYDVNYTSVDGINILNIRDRLDYYKQFIIYGVNKNLRNKIIVEYINGTAKTTSEKFNVENPYQVNFINLDNNKIEYSSEITNAKQWSKTFSKAKKWKIELKGDKYYSVTISENEPKKIIGF